MGKYGINTGYEIDELHERIEQIYTIKNAALLSNYGSYSLELVLRKPETSGDLHLNDNLKSTLLDKSIIDSFFHELGVENPDELAGREVVVVLQSKKRGTEDCLFENHSPIYVPTFLLVGSYE